MQEYAYGVMPWPKFPWSGELAGWSPCELRSREPEAKWRRGHRLLPRRDARLCVVVVRATIRRRVGGPIRGTCVRARKAAVRCGDVPCMRHTRE
eukprot:6250898-Prymnesium_polylepis.1